MGACIEFSTVNDFPLFHIPRPISDMNTFKFVAGLQKIV